MTRSSLALALAVVCGAAALPCAAQEAPVRLTLDEAIALARKENDGLKAVRLRLEEKRRESAFVFTNYLPRIRTFANYMSTTEQQGITLPKGSMGYVPEIGARFPRSDRFIPQGGSDMFFALTTVTQPITQFFKIKEGRGVAAADVDAAEAALQKTEQDVTLGVIQAYAGVVLAERGRDVARERVAAAELRSGYQATAVLSGSAADVVGREARVHWLQGKQELLEREGEVEDLSYKLADALGLPAGTKVQVEAPPPPDLQHLTLEEYLATAVDRNPEVLEARALVDKATHGVGFAKSDYIPDVGILVGDLLQTSLPFFPKNTLAFGLAGQITLFDFGARGKALQERRAQLGQAQLNRAMIENRVRGDVEAGFRKLARAEAVLALAEEGLQLRSEGARLLIAQARVGYGVPAQEHEANADQLAAEMDLLKAQFGYRIALTELQGAAGQLAP